MADDPGMQGGVEGAEGGLEMDVDLNNMVSPQPPTARAVADLLKESGVLAHEPRVVYQLVEFITTYVHGVLETAEEYAEHAGRMTEQITWPDIALAIGKSKGPQVDPLGVFEPVLPSGFPSKPNAQLLKTMAESVNAKKLPEISKKAGLALPGDESCLTAQNYEILEG